MKDGSKRFYLWQLQSCDTKSVHQIKMRKWSNKIEQIEILKKYLEKNNFAWIFSK